ncbi:Tetratricopeptide repeat protein [Planctomycetes bacterium Pla163]|uniref:Tetratricopeptide repeat protein n=1 Tax=Rohdeia mirabilis TaxID=2528008 RepID=A0A518D366_9BACT|nr:Tetratricopeptide repeat protein [Planctomycetes bacterium Pla163]
MSASQTPDQPRPADSGQPSSFHDRPDAEVAAAAAGPSGLQRALIAIAALLTLLSPFLVTFGEAQRSVGNELVGDGLLLVTQHPVMRSAPVDSGALLAALTTDWWSDLQPGSALYRPVPTFILGLTSIVSSTGQDYAYNLLEPGTSGLPFKFLMIAGKIICALLVLELAFAFTKDRRIAFLAGLLFAVLPVHGQTVLDIGGLATITATIFSLAAWLAWLRAGAGKTSALIACAVFTLLAALSMEFAFLLPLVFLAGDAGRAGKGGLADGLRFAAGRLGAMVPVAVALLVAVGLRVAMTGQLLPQYMPGSEVENPLIAAGAFTRILDGLRLAIAGLPVMVGINPFSSGHLGFSADYSAPQIALGSAFGLANLIGLAAWALAIGAVVLVFARCRTRGALLLATLVALLAQAHIVAPMGDVFSERLLFFPSAILAILLASLVAPVLGRIGSTPGNVVALVAAAVLAWFGVARAGDFSNDRDLWRVTSRTTAEASTRAHFNYGRVLLREDSPSSAKTAFERAITPVKGQPSTDHTWARALLSRALLMDGEDAGAAVPLTEAIAIQIEREGGTWAPSRWDNVLREDRTDILLWQLTSIRVDRGIDPEGHLDYLDGLLASGYQSPYVHLYRGDTLRTLARLEEAEQAYRDGIAIEPIFSIVRRLGRFMRQQGRDGEAEVLYQTQLARMNEGSDASPTQRMEFLYQSADLAFSKGDFDRASGLLAEIFILEPRDSLRFRSLLLQAELLTDAPIEAATPLDREVTRLERMDEAAKIMREACITWAVNDELTRYAWQKYTSLLYELGRYTAASNALLSFVNESDSPTMRARLGECLYWQCEANGSWTTTALGATTAAQLAEASAALGEAARRSYAERANLGGQEYLAISGMYADTRLFHLRALLRIGDNVAFEEAYRTELDRSTEEFGPLLVRIYREIEIGTYEDARTSLADMLDRYPESQLFVDNVRSLLADLEQRLIVVGSNPTPEALRACAELQFGLKDFKGAQIAASEAIRLSVGDPVEEALSRAVAAEFQQKVRGPSEALKLIEDAIAALGDANPQLADMLQQRRRLLYAMLGRDMVAAP